MWCIRGSAPTDAGMLAVPHPRCHVEPDLREVYLGEWEGGSFRKHVSEGHPVALRMYAEQRWDVIPGAEPGEAFAARVRGAIGRIAAAHPDPALAKAVRRAAFQVHRGGA